MKFYFKPRLSRATRTNTGWRLKFFVIFFSTVLSHRQHVHIVSNGEWFKLPRQHPYTTTNSNFFHQSQLVSITWSWLRVRNSVSISMLAMLGEQRDERCWRESTSDRMMIFLFLKCIIKWKMHPSIKNRSFCHFFFYVEISLPF